MLPDRAQQDQVGGKAMPQHRRQRRHAIIDPADTLIGMQLLAVSAHLARRLDCHDLVALLGKPRRVPPGAGADIEDQAGASGEMVDEPSQQVVCGHSFVWSASACSSYQLTAPSPPRRTYDKAG